MQKKRLHSRRREKPNNAFEGFHIEWNKVNNPKPKIGLIKI